MNTSTSADSKGVTGAMRWQESNWVGWVDSEGVRRTARPIEALGKRASMGRKAPSSAKATAGGGGIVPTYETIIAYWYRMSSDYL